MDQTGIHNAINKKGDKQKDQNVIEMVDDTWRTYRFEIGKNGRGAVIM